MPAETKSKGRILVIRGGDIREFVLTCPVFSALRAQFPETSIETLGYPRIAELGKIAGLIDDVRSIETRAAAQFFARNARLDEDLAKYFASFSIIFSYLYDPDGIFQANVGKVSQAQFIAGPARPSEGENIHAAEAFLKPLEKLAIFRADMVPRLNLSREESLGAGPWIALDPGRDDTSKNWPEAKWRLLAESIVNKTGYQIFLVGLDADARRLERIAQGLAPERVALLKESPLPTLASRLVNCQAFIGPDSGALQLAAATGIPCVALWGASNPAIWRPPGHNVTLLRNKAGIVGVTQEEVFSALPMVWTGAE